MKRLVTIVVLSTGLIAGPAAADHEDNNLLTKENIGGAVGRFPLGEKVAHNYYGGKHRSGYRHYRHGHVSRTYQPSVYPMKEILVARTTSNVRAGPGTRFAVTGRLYRHERVFVVGKVKHRNWYMIRDHGRHGFVYAPLLTRHYRGHGDYYRHDDHDDWDDDDYDRDDWRDDHDRDDWDDWRHHHDHDDWDDDWDDKYDRDHWHDGKR